MKKIWEKILKKIFIFKSNNINSQTKNAKKKMYLKERTMNKTIYKKC